MTGLRTTLSCFDRIFDEASSENYNMSIRLQPDGLLFSIQDHITLKYIGFQSIMLASASEIYDFIGKSGLLRSNYYKTVCITPSSKYTIVPGALYMPDQVEEYFQFVNHLKNDEELGTCKLLFDDAALIYATELAYTQIVHDFFPKAVILPGVAAFSNFILPRYRNSSTSSMFLNINHDNFDLILLNDGKLIFCNNFSFKAVEDLIYYTIFVVDQLKVNQEKVELKLSGNVDLNSDLIKLLRKYIKNVEMLAIEQEVQMSYALNDLEKHRYIDLFNPRLCEL